MKRNFRRISPACVAPVSPGERLMPTRKITDLFAERVNRRRRGGLNTDATFGGLSLESRSMATSLGRSATGWEADCGGFSSGAFRHQTGPGAPGGGRRAGARAPRHRSGRRERERRLSTDADTFATALQDYLIYAQRNWAARTLKETKRTLERMPLRAWHSRPISSITRGDIIKLVDSVLAGGAEIGANRTLAYLRAMFNWAVKRGRLVGLPLQDWEAPTKERPRDRVLSDDELRWLWHACAEIDWPFGPLVNLLLLTAQRRDEVASLEWAELDLDKRTWTLPREKAKNDRAHEIQLSHAAIEVLKSAVPNAGIRLHEHRLEASIGFLACQTAS